MRTVHHCAAALCKTLNPVSKSTRATIVEGSLSLSPPFPPSFTYSSSVLCLPWLHHERHHDPSCMIFGWKKDSWFACACRCHTTAFTKKVGTKMQHHTFSRNISFFFFFSKPNPIFHLTARFKADPNAEKMNLGVGGKCGCVNEQAPASIAVAASTTCRIIVSLYFYNERQLYEKCY